jgi:hypothetical protein
MENKLSPHRRWLTCTLRDSAIFALLFALVALGWLLALRMPDQHMKGEQYQQDANDSGGQDAWPLSSTR